MYHNTHYFLPVRLNPWNSSTILVQLPGTILSLSQLFTCGDWTTFVKYGKPYQLPLKDIFEARLLDYEHKRATAEVSPSSHTNRHARCASSLKRNTLAIDPWPHCGGLAYGAHGSRKLCTFKMRSCSSRNSKSHEPSRTKFPARQMQNRAWLFKLTMTERGI